MELEKCETFQRSKADESMKRISLLEKEVLGLVAELDHTDVENPTEPSTPHHHHHRHHHQHHHHSQQGDHPATGDQTPADPTDTREAVAEAHSGTIGDVERNVRSMRDDDAGSDDDDLDDGVSDVMTEDSVEERFKDLEDEVAVLVADVHDLSLFTKLNFTGFIKIVKKHDVSLAAS